MAKKLVKILDEYFTFEIVVVWTSIVFCLSFDWTGMTTTEGYTSVYFNVSFGPIYTGITIRPFGLKNIHKDGKNGKD